MADDKKNISPEVETPAEVSAPGQADPDSALTDKADSRSKIKQNERGITRPPAMQVAKLYLCESKRKSPGILRFQDFWWR